MKRGLLLQRGREFALGVAKIILLQMLPAAADAADLRRRGARRRRGKHELRMPWRAGRYRRGLRRARRKNRHRNTETQKHRNQTKMASVLQCFGVSVLFVWLRHDGLPPVVQRPATPTRSAAANAGGRQLPTSPAHPLSRGYAPWRADTTRPAALPAPDQIDRAPP